MKEYKAKISINDSSKLSGKHIKNIKKKDDELFFYTDDKSIKVLMQEIDNIEYDNIFKKRLMTFLKKHLISLVALFIITLLLINQSIAIREIRFINYNTYDKEVETFLEERLKKIGPFYYLDDSLNNINFDIKSKFYDYEWISVSKNGSFLDVDIKKQHIPGYENEDDGIVGDYIASRDAIIKLYYVKKGIVFVFESQSVKKGDLLVSGNLKYHLNEVEYIKPQAIVIGEVVEYQNIRVKKNQTREQRNGKITIKKHLTLFNGSLFNKKPYDNADEEKFELFNAFDFIKINKSVYYEFETVNITYNYDEALTYAKSLIRKDFNADEYEKIIFIKLVSSIEDSNYYDFEFIIKKQENIAQFVPVKVE